VFLRFLTALSSVTMFTTAYIICTCHQWQASHALGQTLCKQNWYYPPSNEKVPWRVFFIQIPSLKSRKPVICHSSLSLCKISGCCCPLTVQAFGT
jgi:hypothetical protein